MIIHNAFKISGWRKRETLLIYPKVYHCILLIFHHCCWTPAVESQIQSPCISCIIRKVPRSCFKENCRSFQFLFHTVPMNRGICSKFDINDFLISYFKTAQNYFKQFQVIFTYHIIAKIRPPRIPVSFVCCTLLAHKLQSFSTHQRGVCFLRLGLYISNSAVPWNWCS